MSTSYKECGDDVQKLCASVMKKHHKELDQYGVTVRCYFAENNGKAAVKVNGLPTYAMVKSTTPFERLCGMADAVILIDLYRWDGLDEKARRALIDHELSHVKVKFNKKGGMKSDTSGRPFLGMCHHDWYLTGFSDVVKRHGVHSIEFMGLKGFAETTGGQRVFSCFEEAPWKGGGENGTAGGTDEESELEEKAIAVFRETGRASTSAIQRRLKIGASKAAKLMIRLEARGIVGPTRGAEPREILIDLTQGENSDQAA